MPTFPWPRALVLSALLLGTAASDSTVTVHLTLIGDRADAVPVTVELHAMQSGDPDTVHRFDATAPGSISVAAPRAQSWRVEVRADGYWSAPRTVKRTEALTALHVDLWRATEVRGALGLPKGTDVPHAISLRLQSNEAETKSRLEQATLVCPIVGDDRRFRCTVPRLGRADLRFRSPGFASRFFWDVDLGKGDRIDVGKLTFRPGASVVGHVTSAAPVDLRDVELALSTSRVSPYPIAEGEGETIRANADEHGFFSLEGLNPGVYRLVARHPELADAEVAPVRVLEGAQTEIEAPIALAQAQPLRLTVEPPFDPDQQDWRVKVTRSASPGQRSGSPVVEASTSAGFIRTDGIALGAYEVEILDSHGQPMLRTRISHAETSGLHALKVDAIRVEGEVTLGGEPLLAQLRFRRPGARRQVESDLDGRFMVVLPAAGTWGVEVISGIESVSWNRRDIEVHAKEGVAELRLDLPDTRISGSVVDVHGVPQAGATVILENLARDRFPVERRSKEDGSFAFRGLDEDAYIAAASLGKALSSEPEQVQLREDAEAVVRLVLRPNRILKGRIVDPAGNALPHVWLLTAAYTGANRLDTLRDEMSRTDGSGAFRLSLRASTARVALMALVPGLGTRSVLLPPGDAGDIVVGPDAGSIRIELEAPWVFAPSRPLPLLVTPHGFRIHFAALYQWAGLNDAPVVDPARATRFTLPLLEPGPYRLCWMTVSDLASRLRQGQACVGGNLGVGETLRIQRPLIVAPSSAPSHRFLEAGLRHPDLKDLFGQEQDPPVTGR